MALHHYIPQDRLHALVQGRSLPEQTQGTALFADITGFTALTEALRSRHGERRGIEELMLRVNAVYGALIGGVDAQGGSVIGFAGDAITCWFDQADGQPALRAAHAARAMQAAMAPFEGLSVKLAVATGAARRFAVGDPCIQLIDSLGGATLDRVARGESLAAPGEILVDESTAQALVLPGRETRLHASGERFTPLTPNAVLHERTVPLEPAAGMPSAEQLKPWVLPFVFEREQPHAGLFETDLRPATALFMRLSGLDFDAQSDAVSLLNQLVSQAQAALQRHGGVLLELTIGDKGCYLYASFGAAQVHEDDAARALRAALVFQQAVADTRCNVRMGLSSGTLRVGGYGGSTRRSFGAMGDDVNTAARLMGQAQPGEILVSGRVRQAVGSEFALEPRAPMPMKGKAEPLPVCAVLGLQAPRGLRLQEPESALPLVGREAELGVLEAALADALAGRGRVLGITADAGMGKSRLVAEALRLATRSRFIGYGGAGQAGGLGTPYFAWRPVWSAFFGIDAALPQRRQVRAAEAALKQQAPAHADAWPLLGAVLGQDWPDTAFTRALQPKDRKALLETLLLRCLESAAQEAAADGLALLLVLEDLHTADPLSQDLLALVARSLEPWPVLLLVSSRPVDNGPLQTLQDLPHVQQLQPRGLDPAQTEQLIRAKLAVLFPERMGAVPADLIARINSRAQGNPFFVEELLNYLHDRGIDPRHAQALDSLELPASLHSLVLSRIDGLPLQQQQILKVASVIGRAFRVTDLHDTHPALGDEASIEAHLRDLGRLGLTPPDPASVEPGFLFQHVVTQEVAYESMAYATRAQLHGRYAAHLERSHADRLGPLAPQLAHHYAEAGVHDKACLYLRKAGEQAAARFANDEALTCFARALKWLPPHSHEDRWAVLEQREAVYALQGRQDLRRADLAEMDRLADDLADPAAAHAEVAVRRSQLEMDAGDFFGARVWAKAAVAALPSGDQAVDAHRVTRVDALVQEARAVFFSGKADQAGPTLQRALDLSRAVPYAVGETKVLSLQGLLQWQQGHYDAADELLVEAERLVGPLGDPRRHLDVLNNLGVVAKTRGRHVQALAHYEAAQVLARRIGDRSGEAMLLNNMGDVCLEQFNHVQAGIYADQAAAVFEAVHDQVSRGTALINRAEAHRGLGQFGLARTLSEQALEVMRTAQHRKGEAVALHNLGLVARALGDFEQALRFGMEALAVAREIGSRALEGSVQRHIGQAHGSLNQWAPAGAALDEAVAIALELGAPQPLIEARAAQAELALAHGGPGRVEQALAGVAAALPALLSPDDSPSLQPMWVHAVAHRALRTAGDARAGLLQARGQAELMRRAGHIADTLLRQSYLQLSEHQDFLPTAIH